MPIIDVLTWVWLAYWNDPAGAICSFCGELNWFADDCGWFMIWPDPEVFEGRYACQTCMEGEPGQKHVGRFGVGER